MKSFEMSSKEDKNGKRHFKAVLYKIHPDSCVDESNQVGTEYQKNGITWIRQYCEKALSSIEGMFLRCEFLDDERTEIHGHGLTDIIDDEPVFEDATTIGVFTKGYIDEIETDEGLITACIGEGEIDSQCYHNFVEKLAEWFRLGGEEFNPNHNFTMQNGAEKLYAVFDEVMPLFYNDSLHITETEDLVTYLHSLVSFKAVLDLPEQKIRDILEKHAVSGAIDLPKDYGMFICR